jgi:hypothetical protein
MGSVIGDVLPLGVGVAISPLPIIAVILMLLAPRAGAASAAFLAGWVVGIVVTVTSVAIIADAVGLSNTGAGSTARGIVRFVLGLILLALAVREWRGRPHDGLEARTPKWLAAVESVTPVKAAGLGFVLAAVNPKNHVVGLGAGVAIGASGLPTGEIVGVIAVFTVLAASSVAAPVVVYQLAREPARAWLTSLKNSLVANNAVVMAVLFVVIGVVLIGKGIGGL